ncbi:MAG: hypothetical protein KDD60_10555, partial [Bdellovibrionales bacterium]|nr:hypothetical protein [Bdellovibrionales bacterium]
SVVIDDLGKILPPNESPFVRIATTPELHQAQAICQKIDDEYVAQLDQLQQRLPSLFLSLYAFSPLIVRMEATSTVIGLPVNRVQGNDNNTALSELIRLREVEPPTVWPNGFTLPAPETFRWYSLPHVTAEQAPPSQSNEILVKRSDIIHRMRRDSPPDFQWIEQRLKPFEVQHVTRKGTGHMKFIRPVRDENGNLIEREANSWGSIRESRPVPISYLWEVLQKLQISLQEFHDSLSD